MLQEITANAKFLKDINIIFNMLKAVPQSLCKIIAFYTLFAAAYLVSYSINNNINFKPKFVSDDTHIHYYYINLESSVERKAFMESQIKEHGLKLERIDATNYQNIIFELTDINGNSHFLNPSNQIIKLADGQQLRVYCNPTSWPNPDIVKTNSDKFWRDMVMAEFGLMCTANKLWNAVSKMPDNTIVAIFEDDIKFTDNFKPLLSQAVNELPTDFDILFLGSVFENGHNQALELNRTNLNNIFSNKSIIEIQPSVFGTGGYVINPSSARKLLNMQKLMPYAIDDMIIYGDVYSKIHGLEENHYYLTKLELYEHSKDHESTIDTQGLRQATIKAPLF